MSFESLTRNVHAILSFYNEKSELVDISRAVESIEVKQVTCSDDILKMGEFCKNSLEFTYRTEFIDTPIAWNNKRVKLSFTEGKTEEEQEANKVDVGIFYVTTKNVETSNNGRSYKVTAYDLPDVMSEQFNTTACTSTSVSDIVSYICKISGMSFVSGTTFSLKTITSIEDKITNVGMLAYIVGYDGKNIRTTADGKLETYWYYSNSDSTHFNGTITRSSQFLDEFTCKENSSELNAITCGYGSGDDVVTYSVGSGVALTYTNPYMTQDELQTIFNRVKGFDYGTGSIKFTGNPNYRCGDVVQAETTKGTYVLFPIMEQTISFDGGLKSTITSYTYETENTVMGSGSPTDKKISQAYNGLTKEFQRQTGIVNDNLKGGYYRLLQDTDTKYPYGWQIADSEEITSTTKGWQWTQGGLIYSQDGFKTASNIAITMDGAISANFITTGTMSVERLAIMGSSGETMKITSDSQGAVFNGTGWFKVNAVGGITMTNKLENNRSNILWLRYISSSARLESFYGNTYYDSDAKTYKFINMFNAYLYDSNKGSINITNRNVTDYTACNNIIFNNNGDTRDLSINNFSSGGVKSNTIYMNTTSSTNYMNLVNYQHDTTTYANAIKMFYSSSSSYGMELVNYSTSGKTQGRLVFTGGDSANWNVLLAGGDYTNSDVWLGMKNNIINFAKGSSKLLLLESDKASFGTVLYAYSRSGYYGKVPIVRSNSGDNAVELYYDSGSDKMFVYYDGVLKHFG